MRAGGVELSRSPFGVDIHNGLLVNAIHALDGSDVKRVLTVEITGMVSFDFTVGSVVLFFTSRACT